MCDLRSGEEEERRFDDEGTGKREKGDASREISIPDSFAAPAIQLRER